MPIRGIRGAVNISADEPDEVFQATQELLTAILDANPTLKPDDLASVLFTATPDLHSAYPAQAARAMGWSHVPLLCFQEMSVDGSMPQVVRVLLHWNTDEPQESMTHIYLRGTSDLRPDPTQDRNDK